MQNSWPQVYPGMPTGDYSPAWQNYFQVTENLPSVTWSLPRNWAGNIPVQRVGHPNDTLFFWGFESSNGSFTANSSEPWGIWLNGGPGGSSLLGLLIENGPIHLLSNYSLVQNPYAWSTVADYVWMDQPVGTGFSTVDINGYAPDEDQLAADFMGFLENFVKVFPNLATRPLHITGESYAGKYIPYITKAYFGMDNPPVNLTGIAMGDGTMTSTETFNELPVVTVLETYPQIIGYDTQVFEYFQEQSALCGYNLILQYPQPEHFPSLNAPVPFSAAYSAEYSTKLTKQQFVREVQGRHVEKLGKRDSEGARQEHDERLRARDMWKRDLAGRANGTIDPLYECDLYTEMIDYAVNFTFPWSVGHEFDVYNIPDALSPEAPTDGSVFLNDAQTRAAIHAPTSKNWVEVTREPFGPNNIFKYAYGDPSVEPMAFLTELATNATAHDVSIVIYSGNDDSLVPHFGSQIAIQNTTFGGIQGFTRKPETPWYNDAGEFAGIVHQERGWKYVLVANAGHLLGYNNPISVRDLITLCTHPFLPPLFQALALVREFIFGNNETGLVTNTSSGGVSVVGGEMTSLGNEVLTGQAAIYYGAATTASSYFFPSATVEAWNAFISTATPSATSGTSPTPSMGLVSSKVVFLGSALAIALVLLY
ncbi:Alpha/Beta hydrolase protein [Boletus reticuloceps]|uniref:Carboxypeptidase n=1 Tax=Boletus reticuloceps TaxID=495285 RepID=A0A8I2YZ21_9AGAM|nr:Alpha/Beta hydrolase protein [Boletus reticuloceps]